MADLVQTPGTGTVDQLRTNTYGNETELKGEVEQATADIAAHKASSNTDHDGRYPTITALNAHKTSTDHDGRYYTEAEIDAMVAKLTGAQAVAGVKTLTDNPIVKNATASIQYQDASGNDTGRVLSVVANTTDRLMRLQVYKPTAGAYVDVLRGYAEDGSADTDLTLYCKGKRLATIDEVMDRVRSGFFHMQFSRSVATLADGTTYYVQDDGGGAMVIPVPNGGLLRNVTYNYRTAGGGLQFQQRVALPIAFTDSGYQHVYIRVIFSNSAHTLTVAIGAGPTTGNPEFIAWSTVATITDAAFVTGSDVTLFFGLEFSI